MKKISKRDKIIVACLLSIALLFFIWIQISMNWTEVTCAKITRLDRNRGWKVCFVYERNGKVVEDQSSISFFKYKNIYDLQKNECCEIKYSIYWPYRVEIIDKDLKAE
jgi:hypothetical protein